MRHKKSGYKLKRNIGARKALFKGLVTSIIEHERVVTTVPKAKAVRPLPALRAPLPPAAPAGLPPAALPSWEH